MKKTLLVAAAVGLASANAYASKARLSALGQDTDGSYYLMDQRNVFLNPSSMGGSEYINVEWGANQGTVSRTGNNRTTDSIASPNAEGGIVKDIGGITLGLFLGKTMKVSTDIANTNSSYNSATLTSDADYVHPRNTISLGVAGAAGSLKWGGMFLYGTAKHDDKETTTSVKHEASAMEVRGGVSLEDMVDAYVHLYLPAESKRNLTGAASQNDKFESEMGYRVGANYGLGMLKENLKVYVDYEMTSFKAKDGGATQIYNIKGERSALELGFAESVMADNNLKYFWAGGFGWVETKESDSVNNPSREPQTTDAMFLPVALGLEYTANDWLVFRGSVKQRVVIDQGETKSKGANETTTDKTDNFPNSTTAAAGAGLKFGKFMVDGTFAGTTSGNINATNLLANVSFTYSL